MRMRIIIYVNQYTLLINLEQERKRGETIDRQISLILIGPIPKYHERQD